MKTRKKAYGNSNIVGRNIERLRKERGIRQKNFISKLQVMGLDINPTSYSKLEGQLRIATDKEIYIISKVLGVPLEALYKDYEQTLYLDKRQSELQIKRKKSCNRIMKRKTGLFCLKRIYVNKGVQFVFIIYSFVLHDCFGYKPADFLLYGCR